MTTYDLIVVGAGPAGHSAALEAARHGARVALVEMAPRWSGSGVMRGELATETLRGSALRAMCAPADSAEPAPEPDADVEFASLMATLEDRVTSRGRQELVRLEVAGVDVVVGQARFTEPGQLRVVLGRRNEQTLEGAQILWCTGSRPSIPDHLPVDHDHLLDPDSVLSLLYLPRSLVIIGGGEGAAVHATLFAALGVQVTVLDPGDQPLPKLEREQNQALMRAFERRGCRWIHRASLQSCHWDGLDVVALLDDQREFRARKGLVVGGVDPALRGLRLARLGIETTEDGFLAVDDEGRTSVDGLWAAGAVTGALHPPAQQRRAGRRVAAAMLGAGTDLPSPVHLRLVHSIPSLASAGLGEAAAFAALGGTVVGETTLRDEIDGVGGGRLKLVADPTGRQLLGAHAIGEAAEALVLACRDAIAMRAEPLSLLARHAPTAASPAIQTAVAQLVAERERRAIRGPRALFGPPISANGPPISANGAPSAPSAPSAQSESALTR